MERTRTKRRRDARAEKKLRLRIDREMESMGLADRIRAVNKTVMDSVLFWKILKDRIAATESIRDVRDLDVVRAHAMNALAEMGHDLNGVQLKLTWQPPRLFIIATPTIEAAAAVARAVHGESSLVLPSRP